MDRIKKHFLKGKVAPKMCLHYIARVPPPSAPKKQEKRHTPTRPAYLCPKAEAVSVREAGGGVVENARAVHGLEEHLGHVLVLCHDGLRVARPEPSGV